MLIFDEEELETHDNIILALKTIIYNKKEQTAFFNSLKTLTCLKLREQLSFFESMFEKNSRTSRVKIFEKALIQVLWRLFARSGVIGHYL